MAREVAYKQYNKRERRAVLEDDLSKGMMSSDGALDEGYVKYLVNCTYEKETRALIPRPGLRLFATMFPKGATEDSDFLSENITVKASKQCVENGVTYTQIILCKTDDEDVAKGTIWALTASAYDDRTPLKFSDDYSADVSFCDYLLSSTSHICYLYSTDSPAIHDVHFSEDDYYRVQFPVGEFAYGNSFYFIGETTVIEEGEEVVKKGLFRTFFDTTQSPARYEFQKVEPKVPSVSEAVTYGYNMLLGSEAYTFSNKHNADTIQFEGILPYEVGSSQTKLMMTPKKNQPVDMVCYYDVQDDAKYDIVWESRETTSSDWTQLQRDTVTFDSSTKLILKNFLAQDKEIMVRVSAYPYEGSIVVEDKVKAMVVGFDFTMENYGTAKSLEQKEYDLTTATGMETWKGRAVFWGLPEDPTVLFLSDYEDPSYFPYPNNIVVFDEPIIYCVEFMDSLAVFTSDKLYQVSLADDGNSWTTVILQSHLSIEPWDKHLIQTVRNMIYFKSGNYYYMIVPKAQSTTGELTLAPVTTPITSFFDTFSVNVQKILERTYGFTGYYELLTYYNFLDYEDIHNIYAYKFDGTQSIMHFDVIYNTVDRTWKVWVFESPTFVYPIKQEATRYGLLASTALVTCYDVSDDNRPFTERIVQVFSWDKLVVRSCYIPFDARLLFNPEGATSQVEGHTLEINPSFAYLDGHTLVFNSDLYAYYDDTALVLQNDVDFYDGYSKKNILTAVKNTYDFPETNFSFRNYQFLDSGYRNDELQYRKRYREIQFQINNLDKKNMQFGMDYILDGAPRGMYYKYDVAQQIDEFDPNYGVLYIDSTPYMEAELDSIDMTNQWTIDQNLTPEVKLWKIRVSVSGKGYAPRLRLYSRNEKRFELLNIAWVSKIMHMR